MRIDAHQHFWTLARGDYGWLTPASGPALYRDFAPADLAPLLAAAGIEGTVLVQAAPSEAETDFLLDLAADSPFVAGVVGWTDLAADEAPARIAALARREKLVGLRPMVHDLADDRWLLRPSVGAAAEAMAAAGLAFDALVRPRHLPVVVEFAQAHPRLRLVLDHGGKPDLAGGDIGAWARDIAALAAGTSARAKVSGLLTEALPNATQSDLSPAIDVLVAAFGPERLMWGSDWPVLNAASRYADWFAMAHEALGRRLDGAGLEGVFGAVAADFYGLRP